MEDTRPSPLEDLLITNVKSYGSDKDKLVVETVASFRNYFNYRNKPKSLIRQVGEAIEIVPINFDVDSDPLIELIFSQTQKIILDGVEVTNKTKDHLLEFFNKFDGSYREITKDIQQNSVGRDRGLKLD